MHKRKDEIRDIYQGNEHDLDKDFTPQVSSASISERERAMRRRQLVSLFFGTLLVGICLLLIFVIVRDFLDQRTVAEKIQTKETPYIPRYSLPSDSLWVMDYQAVEGQLAKSEPLGPKPVSVKWIQYAAYHLVLGQQALAVNESDAALEHFNKVIEVYPEIEGLQRAVGSLYLKKEDFSLAAKHLEKALKEDESFSVLNNLGTAYIGAEEYDKAENALKRALALLPENPGCHKNLAMLYRKMDRPNDAIFHYEKYIDLQPGDIDTMQSYALYLTKLKRWKEAAEFLTKLTQDVPDNAPIYFLLAQVQVQNGQDKKAFAALQRGIQLVDPQLALAWMGKEEFNMIRGSGDFQNLVDKLEVSTNSAEAHQ